MTQPEAQFRQPQYVREVVRMVAGPGGTVFDDPAKEAALYAGQLSPEELEPYRAMYTAALRVAAVARNISREDEVGDPDYDPQEFNIDWQEENFESQPELAEGLDRLAFGYQVDIRPIAEELQRSKADTWAPRKLLRGIGSSMWWGVAKEDAPAPEPSRVSTRRLRPGESFEGQELDLLPHQEEYMQDIAAFLETCREQRAQMSAGEKRTAFAQGAVVESPTGSGKTVLIAHALKHEEIGTKPPGEEKKRALIIVPSRDLGNQLSRRSGTLRSFVPELSVSRYFHHSRDATGDVVVISIESFVKHFRHGRLDGRKFDLTIIEEGHHLMEPQFRQVFTDHVRSPALLLTATPSYSQDRDIRQLFPVHIKHGNLLEYVYSGILNQAQLFKFLIDPRDYLNLLPEGLDMDDPEVRRKIGSQFVEQAMLDFALNMVQEGRRGMAFCESGGRSAFARRLAERISATKDEHDAPMTVPGGKRLRAEAIGTFRLNRQAGKATSQVIDEYNRGDLQVLTTVEAGREGLDLSDVDFVLIGSPTVSLLRLKQMIGRGTRVSERFPVTVFVQFTLPDNFRKRDSGYDLYQAFDLEEPIEQGAIIGRRSNEGGGLRSQGVDPERLASILHRSLSFTEEPMNLAGVGPDAEVDIPDSYIALGELVSGTVLTETQARLELRKAGFRWRGRLETVGDDRVLIRHYEPAARPFIQNRNTSIIAGRERHGRYADGAQQSSAEKLPHVASDDMDAGQIAVLAGDASLSKRLSEMLAEYSHLDPGKRKLDRHGFPRLFWDRESAAAIAPQLRAWVDAHPLAPRSVLPPHMLPVVALERIFGSSYKATAAKFDRLGLGLERLMLQSSVKNKTACVTWSSIRRFEEALRKPIISGIDYQRLPRDEHDTDPDRIAYARAIQVKLCSVTDLELSEDELARARALADELFSGYW